MNKGFTPKPAKLADQVIETLPFHHYACSTEKNSTMAFMNFYVDGES